MSKSTQSSSPLQSVHTNTLPQLLHRLKASLVVSMYQSGKVVLVRADGDVANTHFRDFQVPMGVTWSAERNRLAISTYTGIWEFHNQADVAQKLESNPQPGQAPRHDAVFLPRQIHLSGHLATHEIGYTPQGLIAVNTKFSCLCTFDSNHSFTPIWKPPFVSAYSLDDRCHMNGLCMVDGQPRYVTCLGATDSSVSWRANKAAGGVLVEYPSGQIVARGLCMPHSPRIYNGSFWILESGAGTLSRLDLPTGKTDVVTQLPGFTRGLDFYGPFAFVGLSQVRESSLFSNLPLTDRIPVSERRCGVWVIDIRSGQVVAFLQFTDGVQEVFSVQVLPNITWPELITDLEGEIVASSYVLPEDALRQVAI